MKAHEQKLKNELVSRRLLTEEQYARAATDMNKSKASLKDTVLKLAFVK